MRRIRKPWRLILAVASLLLAGCGGGGGGERPPPDNRPPPPPPPPPVITGVFKDLNVSGLAYTSGQQSGITSANGRFTCETGNNVAFSIGGVSLGQAECATLVTPTQLVPVDADFQLQVTNIARFLQMLDVDGDPDNGIVLSELLQQIADNWLPVDFRTNDLAGDVVMIMSDAASVDGTVHALPGEQEALVHLAETLSCAYAGAYGGTFSGSNSGAAGMVIGWGAASFGFLPNSFEWQGIDAVNEFSVFGGGSGSITILDLPQIDHTDPSLAGPIAAQFETPDRITGTWSGGNVSLSRIGADNGGRYRFVGRASGDEVAAYISLNLTDTSFAGEAFDVVSGTTFAVSGTLAGNTVTLNATGGGETLTGSGTLEPNADGSPREILGSLSDGSTFSIAACRLN